MAKEIDLDAIRCTALFEKLTNVYVEDCVLLKDTVIFIVKRGQMNKAIGRNGSTINRVRSVFKNKKVFVIEDDDTVEGFIKNMYPKLDIEVETKQTPKGNLAVIKVDRYKRGVVIGTNGDKIKANRILLKRKFNYDLKVV